MRSQKRWTRRQEQVTTKPQHIASPKYCKEREEQAIHDSRSINDVLDRQGQAKMSKSDSAEARVPPQASVFSSNTVTALANPLVDSDPRAMESMAIAERRSS